LKCKPQEIDAYYNVLKSLLDDFPAGVVVNVDETGHQDWADSRADNVVVPVTDESVSIRIPIDRDTKRATIVAAITADGRYLKPLVVILRDTCEAELFQIGFTPEKVLYESQEKGFINIELVNWWTSDVIFPYITQTRERLTCNGQAVVILDGCTSHGSDFFFDESRHTRVRPFLLPMHSSDHTQPLDLWIFCLEKIEAARTKPCPGLNP
jgi:hypothetical protein